MKKLYLLFLFALITSFVNAEQAFITKWQITSANTGIFTFIQSGPGVNYTIDFGDGTVLTNQNSYFSHFYSKSGIYTVSITGSYYDIAISSLDVGKLMSIEQWGTAKWTTMDSAFTNCTNMVINAKDTPDLSNVTSLSYMFANCYKLNQPLDNWDVSHVTTMESMFSNADSFNQPLNSWNVSSVKTFKSMFFNASAFNQPLNNWNVSSATTFEKMFLMATLFNGSINTWDVSGAVNMGEMFSLTTAFNQPLNNWNVSNVTNMTGMFFIAKSFDQPLANWDVSNVDSMASMFDEATAFNQPLNSWNTSRVTTMNSMFEKATLFNQPLSNWNITNVIYIYNMFSEATNFNQDISAWNFGTLYSNLASFLSYTAIDRDNYDALLLKFAQLGLRNFKIGADGLKYCDSGVHDFLNNKLGWTFLGDNLDEQCIGNVIAGTVLFDENSNGCDDNDAPVQNIFISSGNGEYKYAWSTNTSGQYSMRVTENINTVELLNIPSYFNTIPEQSIITFEGVGNKEQLNFCLTANQVVEDLNIVLLPVTNARPGFKAKYQLVAVNNGTQTISNALVSLVYDNTMQSFISATPASTSSSAGQLNFNLANLRPFESRSINIIMLTATPPTINGGDFLHFTATISPNTNDYTPVDNTFELTQTVVNAYDPNDKLVLQGDAIYKKQTGEYLDYIIRFQNTGNGSATNVYIKDDLHANLDWTTLMPVSASHDYNVQITNGGHVEFIFNNINLPHEAANAEGSQGYVAYKIKPIKNIQVGDVMESSANIYFDYNVPVVTNSVTTAVVESLGLQHNFAAKINIYPNPVNNAFHIQSLENNIDEIEIFNMQGRRLMHFKNNPESINVENLSAGIYILVIKANGTELKYKLLKK